MAEPETQTSQEHPEVLIGAAFLGGLVIAQILKRLGPDD